MNIPKLHIGHLTADIPIVQCGMGVRVSLASLTAAGRGNGSGPANQHPALSGLQTRGCPSMVDARIP